MTQDGTTFSCGVLHISSVRLAALGGRRASAFVWDELFSICVLCCSRPKVVQDEQFCRRHKEDGFIQWSLLRHAWNKSIKLRDSNIICTTSCNPKIGFAHLPMERRAECWNAIIISYLPLFLVSSLTWLGLLFLPILLALVHVDLDTPLSLSFLFHSLLPFSPDILAYGEADINGVSSCYSCFEHHKKNNRVRIKVIMRSLLFKREEELLIRIIYPSA